MRVLVIGGHDPTGGAGIQADIETLRAFGLSANCVITLLTAQSPHQVRSFRSVDPLLWMEAIDSQMDSFAFAFVKIGALGLDHSQVQLLGQKLAEQSPLTPILIDPVMRAGGDGTALQGGQPLKILLNTLAEQNPSRDFVMTPNAWEASQLAGIDDPSAGAVSLSQPVTAEEGAAGNRLVVVTGVDRAVEASQPLAALWVALNGKLIAQEQVALRRQKVHGTGCTFASALTASLLLGLNPLRAGTAWPKTQVMDAVRMAQQYCGQAVDAATAVESDPEMPWMPGRPLKAANFLAVAEDRAAGLGLDQSMGIPQIYAITPDLSQLSQPLTILRELVEAGVRRVQYRDKCATAKERLRLAEACAKICHQRCQFIVNDDASLAEAVGADGVHIGQEDATCASIRNAYPQMHLGASAYDRLDLALAVVQAGADAVTFGQVFASPTKVGKHRTPPQSLPALVNACKEVNPSTEVMAIGGLNAANLSQIRDAGVDWVALSSGLFGQPKPVQALQDCQRALGIV